MREALRKLGCLTGLVMLAALVVAVVRAEWHNRDFWLPIGGIAALLFVMWALLATVAESNPDARRRM